MTGKQNPDDSKRGSTLVTVEGQTWFLDATVCSTASTDRGYESACARRDGHATLIREDRKRLKYDSEFLVPVVFELGGRLGPTGLAWLRRVYSAAGQGEALHDLLHTLSVQLQECHGRDVDCRVQSLICATWREVRPSEQCTSATD